jgi:DNA-binding SARP family transcriptional activator
LAYLTVRGEARRDELVDLLWGDVSEANAKNAFRQALHRLRTALGEDVIPQDRERVALIGKDAIASDRDAFLDHLEKGNLAAAVDLYRGDFLEGLELGESVFGSWVDAERTRLKGRFHSALQNASEAALATGRWLEALQYVQRLTAVAPYDETAAVLEANVLVAAGRAAEALVALRRFTQAMREQLDLPPSPRVRDMISRIERADSQREPQPRQKAKEAKFVGREPDIARMMTLARGLAAEQGALIVVEGPAGIGKSRLVTEFIARIRSLGPLLVLRGRERPAGSALPYASVAEAVRGALKAPGVAGTGRHLLAEAARILPELRDSFDLPEPGPIEAEGGRLRFFEGVAALLDSAAYEQPVSVVLDDMHNASGLTIDLVDYLAARLHSSPVLIVLLLRGEADSATLRRVRDSAQSLAESDRSLVLTVEPLDAEAANELVAGLAQERGAEGQLHVERVAAGAAGNPLRAIELTRRALDGEPPSMRPLPLRDVLWSRLQRASPSQRRVFFAAALLQRRCSLRLLSAAAHLPELATLEAAQRLEESGLLTQDADAYVIAHDSTATFVSDASGLAGKALLAGWAADALAAERGATGAELTSLYSIAGQQEPAFTHARRAVYEAAALGAASEVHRLLGLARALAPDTRSREQIEAMLTAFGAGHRLLEGPSPSESASVPPSEAADIATSNEPVPERSQDSAVPAAPSLITARLAALLFLGLVAVAAALVYRQSVSPVDGPRSLRDSLLVVARGMARGNSVFFFTGSIDDSGRSRLTSIERRPNLPDWARSLQLPWIRPSQSPSGVVAAELMTETGTDVYLLSGADGNRIPIAVGPGTDAALGWSPDGTRLLVRRSKALADGSFDADLWAFTVVGHVAGIPIDTSSERSVEDEAQWSPDGSRISWVAQSGPTHQRDVFIARADGSGAIDATENSAEDYHIAWSSDGNLLAFTSDRDGNQDLFAIEFDGRSQRLWRLTRTPVDEDFASFSPDHRFVAFESTAAGDAAVYLMPALGGHATRMTPLDGQFSIEGWRGRPDGYIDRFRIIGPSSANLGDTVRVSVFVADAAGNRRSADTLFVHLGDSSAAELRRGPDSSASYVVRPRRNGIVDLIASIPGWRYDTLSIVVGSAASMRLTDDFSAGISDTRWMALGAPQPTSRTEGGVPALFPSADLQWQSGLLSRGVVSLTDSVDLAATFSAPFVKPVAGASLVLALVDASGRLDSIAPQPTGLVSIQWDGESSRFTYSLGSQSKSDPVSALGSASVHRVRLAMSGGGDVAFFVDDRLRWRSSLRFLGMDTERRARVWLGGKATGAWGSIRDLVVLRP